MPPALVERHLLNEQADTARRRVGLCPSRKGWRTRAAEGRTRWWPCIRPADMHEAVRMNRQPPNGFDVANHSPMPVAMMKAPSSHAHQQEHLGLQPVHQLRLARRGFEELAAHDADADARADGAQADHVAHGEGKKVDAVHVTLLVS